MNSWRRSESSKNLSVKQHKDKSQWLRDSQWKGVNYRKNKLCFTLEDVFHSWAATSLCLCVLTTSAISPSQQNIFFFLLPDWSQVRTTAETTLENAQVIAFMKRVFKGTTTGKCEWLHKNRRHIIRGEKQQMNKMIKNRRRCQKITVTHRTTDAGKYLSEVWFVLLQPSWYHLIVAIGFSFHIYLLEVFHVFTFFNPAELSRMSMLEPGVK